ncbi:N-acetylglucosamine-6-phosphate deacetylase [Spirillospora sp. NPDC050679]
MTLLSGARLVLPGGVRTGALRVADGRIAGVDVPAEPGEEVVDLRGRHVVPGFVDLHVHGAAGASYQSGRPEDARRVAGFHLAHGTTTTMASLVTGDAAELRTAVAGLAEAAADGIVAGVHLEGPHLAAGRCGAHDPALLRDPDTAEFERLVALGRGHVRMITLAPELPGATGLIGAAAAHGVLAALGHTDASAAVTAAGFDAGARVATHLFNGMRPLHHREGGPVAAALTDPRVTLELINDGVHVAAEVVRLVFGAAPGRVALITDAMAATGMGDGDYRLGVMRVQVRDGRAMLADGSSIAGSTITMADAFRRAVVDVGLPIGLAAEAASLVPARTLGLDGRIGSLEPGKDADLVVLDDDLAVARVMKGGRWQ